MSLGILGAQFQDTPFLPASDVVVIQEPRPITLDDNGKYLVYIYATQVFDLPEWADTPPGFTFQVAWMSILTGGDPVDYDTYHGVAPSQNDSVLVIGRWDNGLFRRGMRVWESGQFPGLMRVYRSNLPNQWVLWWTDGYPNYWTDTPDMLRMAVMTDAESSGIAAELSVYFEVCDESGVADGRVLGSIISGAFTPGPDGVSGGPLLPFYMRVHNPGPDSGTTLGVFIYTPPCPPNRTSDFNWAVVNDSDVPPRISESGTPITLLSGQSVSVYMPNFVDGDPYGPVGPFYLRQAPGETTPRSWAQAFALGPY